MGTVEPLMCDAAGCKAPRRGSAPWCNLHRQRVRKHGSPSHERWPSPLERLLSRIVVQGDCWVWIGSFFVATGYGQFWYAGTNRLAHRVAYQMLVGPIKAGLELDHLCLNKACVNPEHLEPVTPLVNTRRARAIQRQKKETA